MNHRKTQSQSDHTTANVSKEESATLIRQLVYNRMMPGSSHQKTSKSEEGRLKKVKRSAQGLKHIGKFREDLHEDLTLDRTEPSLEYQSLPRSRN